MGILDILGFGKKSDDIKEFVEKGAIVIDVRTYEEFASGHIKGAKNIPLQVIGSKINDIKKLNKPVIACCRSGMRSAQATSILKQHGIDCINGGGWNSLETTNGAASWVRIGESLQDQMIVAMVLDRTRAGVIYLAGRDGIHRSEDVGLNWTPLNDGFTTTNIRSLAQSATDAKVFYGGTNGSGLYKSLDGGAHWEPMPSVFPKE